MAININFQGINIRKPSYWGMPKSLLRPHLLIENIPYLPDYNQIAVIDFYRACFKFGASEYFAIHFRPNSQTPTYTLVLSK